MPELEDRAYWDRNFERNSAYLAPGEHTYNTQLMQPQEGAFRQWVVENNVPFDVNAAFTDYDMRGFWAAMQRGDPIAASAVNPNDKQIHYPDYWKTPYSATFSNESQWANPQKAPLWRGDLYVLPDGTVLWNDKEQKWVGPDAPWSVSTKTLMEMQRKTEETIKMLRGTEKDR